jgi:LPS sulfotransferase NodH
MSLRTRLTALIHPATTPAVNFIVLGHPRCGSNLLIRALTEHPQIRALNEIFERDTDRRTQIWNTAKPVPAGLPYQIGEDGATFLCTRVFSPHPIAGRQAFGFKLFYHHARFDPHIATAWDYLHTLQPHILHIRRRNLLDVIISREVALRTNIWLRESADPAQPVPPFDIDPTTCLGYFQYIEDQRRVATEFFAQSPTLHLDYDTDLSENFPATANRAFQFLGCTPHPSAPGLVQQRTIPPSRQLSNYAVLKAAAANTPYAHFFT